MLASGQRVSVTVAADALVLGLILAALVAAADLYLQLIRRRARRRREVRDDDEALLRSLVRVFLAEEGKGTPSVASRELHDR
jgi:hypothetical protein